MITSLVNPALKLALGVPSATLTFNTDGTPAIQTTLSTSANGTSLSVASALGMFQGGFLSIEGAGLNGTVPWVVIIGASSTGYSSAAQSIGASFPSARTTVTNAVANMFERFETRYRAKKLTLTNQTTGDVFTWDTSLKDGQAYKTSAGTTTTLAFNGFLNRSNCVGIHPNLLPVNCSFTLQCDYDYHG
jgi:hypothetical protein